MTARLSTTAKISPARRAAYDVLFKIETERAFSSTLLPEYENDLSPLDRGLCHELVLGVLRRQIKLDRLIDELVGYRKLDIEVRIILRLGLFQLLFLERVPAHAAVNESVALANGVKKSSARGLVNAVLRKASQGLPELTFADEIDRISVETSHPHWLIERWAENFGGTRAAQIAAANNQTPDLAFRRTQKGSAADLTRYELAKIVEGCYIADAFDPELRRLAESGEIYFQNEASQLVASAVNLAAGEIFLDVCASPGGKTTAVVGKTIAAAANASRGLFVAGDVTDRRVRLLRETCVKQGLEQINLVQYDAAVSLPFADSTFDVVLVDAPCTGTGTIRHNPEIRYFVKPDDFQRMHNIQIAILSRAARVVRPGGRLIYSTCSLERDENEAVCKAFLTAQTAFITVPPSVPERSLTSDGHARTFPDRDKTDGFFIAEFYRHN